MASFNLNYPHQDEGQKTLTLDSGQIMFMVGPNGTGKSTLMHMFTIHNHGNVRRITAHRQVWFNSDSVDITPASRIQTEQHITNNDRQEQSRWKDDYAQQRSQATIFDLIDAENIEAREIANAARNGDMDVVASLALNQAPVAMMNDILMISNLHFKISIDTSSKLVAIREEWRPVPLPAGCSLPHRQLRKAADDALGSNPCSLPHRQLRKTVKSINVYG